MNVHCLRTRFPAGAGLLAALVLLGPSCGETQAPAGPDRPAAPAVEPPAATPPPAPERLQAQWWYEETFLDYAGRPLPLTGAQVRARVAEAERRGYPRIEGLPWEEMIGRVYRHLLEREPDDPDANRAFGRVPLSDYPGFFAVFARLCETRALPEDFAALRNRFEDRVRLAPLPRAPSLEADDFAAVAETLDRFVAFEQRLAADPAARAIHEALHRVRLHPVLGAYEVVRLELTPFVLFYSSGELARRDASGEETRRVAEVETRLRARLATFRGLLEAYLAFFRATWMEPFRLPDFERGRPLFVWVFGDRASFDAYGEKRGLHHPPGLLGYFDPQERWVFLFDDASDRGVVETSLVHEVTHQLHWHFSRDEESYFQDNFRLLHAVWFTEGWAEYAAWFRKSGGAYRFAQPSPARLATLREAARAGLPLYPLRRLVRCASYEDYVDDVLHRWLPGTVEVPQEQEARGRLAGAYLELLYAQSWLFVRFLYEAEEGRYRERVMRFTRATLDGFAGQAGSRRHPKAHEVFETILGLDSEESWSKLQASFDAYRAAMQEKG